MKKRSVVKIKNNDNINKFLIYIIPILLFTFIVIILGIAAYYSNIYMEKSANNAELNTLTPSTNIRPPISPTPITTPTPVAPTPEPSPIILPPNKKLCSPEQACTECSEICSSGFCYKTGMLKCTTGPRIGTCVSNIDECNCPTKCKTCETCINSKCISKGDNYIACESGDCISKPGICPIKKISCNSLCEIVDMSGNCKPNPWVKECPGEGPGGVKICVDKEKGVCPASCGTKQCQPCTEVCQHWFPDPAYNCVPSGYKFCSSPLDGKAYCKPLNFDCSLIDGQPKPVPIPEPIYPDPIDPR
ncbi:MAG: hypothetical protein WC867_05415 [Candidatus Pacearchaeota archaeon]|jgi:hypothetical protein